MACCIPGKEKDCPIHMPHPTCLCPKLDCPVHGEKKCCELCGKCHFHDEVGCKCHCHKSKKDENDCNCKKVTDMARYGAIAPSEIKNITCPIHPHPEPKVEKCEGICKHCPYYVNECPKDHPTPQPSIQDWEKNFDLLFTCEKKNCPHGKDLHWEEHPLIVKVFIRQTLASERSHFIDDLENMLDDGRPLGDLIKEYIKKYV